MAARPYLPKHHVQISSTDDFSSNYSPSRGTNEAVQSIVTSRKCWKTIKGKGEVVWPPQLEAALVEGLERYRPVETRSARALGRFPMRNKFISDYIYQVTGKHRTPKQVGSRLQQLRDTCEGKRILKLLSHRPGSPRSPSADHSTASPEPSSAAAPARDYLNVDVLPADAPWPGAAPAGFRPLRTISNTVTFRSPTAVAGESRCQVLRHGAPVYAETTPLQLHNSSCTPAAGYSSDVSCTFFYTVALVPSYWQVLCNETDIGAYSIAQEIVARTPPPPHAADAEPFAGASTAERVLSSVVYHFNTPHASPPSSPSSSNGDAYSYTTESSRELEHMFDIARAPPPAASPAQPYAPQHQQQQPPRYAPHFDMAPPALVRADDDGYASLPQSPLDAVFPPHVAALGALSAGAGKPYADVDYAAGFDVAGAAPAPAYAHALSGTQYSGF